jgi:hypothetical protein
MFYLRGANTQKGKKTGQSLTVQVERKPQTLIKIFKPSFLQRQEFFVFGSFFWGAKRDGQRTRTRESCQKREREYESGEEIKIKIKRKSKFSEKRERGKRERESDKESVEK